MGSHRLLRKIVPRTLLSRLGVSEGIERMAFNEKLDVREDILSKYGFDGDLLNLFVNNKGYPVHKWHHYIPIYDHYFSKFRDRKVKFLEIGVFKGGSLQMWREYFGPDATIFGIDTDAQCKELDGIAGQVRIGSQVDNDFMRNVVEEMGGVDIVLDDGSHQAKHVRKTFQCLFPMMSPYSIYMIEDLHTSFWRGYGGGYRSKSNFFSFANDLINDMHHFWHVNPIKYPKLADLCSGIHFHDSIAVFERGNVFKPTHSVIS